MMRPPRCQHIVPKCHTPREELPILLASSYSLLMHRLDDIDRALLARLRDDGRASVSSLAADLHVARGTAQTRLNRLVTDGVIRRFTIELDPEHEKQIVRAVTLVELHGTTTKAVAQVMRRIPEVVEMHATNGSWDIVADLSATSLGELDRALVELRGVRGVVRTETSILLRTL